METKLISAIKARSKTVDQRAIIQAVQTLRGGGLVAFPTDTVYGLGAMVNNPAAIDQIYTVKDRDLEKAIPVLIGQIQDLEQVAAALNPIAKRLVTHFWPGPLTLVLLRHPDLPKNLSNQPTIGVRMPDHPLALKLLKQAGPLAVTSANLSGEPSTCTAQEVVAQLGGRIPLVLDGGSTPGGIPSTVVDCTTSEPQILRTGPITVEQINAAL